MNTAWRTGGLMALALVVSAWTDSRPLQAADGDTGPSAADVQAVLRDVRESIRRAAPEAKETV